jgi:hypothetical protein
MQILLMIWNGIGGLGAGSVILKALFIIFLVAIFWMFCELVKYLINVISKLAVDMLRYLAVVLRGWPEDSDELAKGGDTVKGKSSDHSPPADC